MEIYPTWIRLHPDSTDDTLATAVQARIHDPLWLLGRQWQLGELRHDAGATPVDVRVEGTSSPITRLRGGAAGAVDPGAAHSAATVNITGIPLEAMAECEPVSESGLSHLRLRTEAGLHLLRMLRAAGVAEGRVTDWVTRCPFERPDGLTLDADTSEWLDLVAARVPDGARLPAAIVSTLGAGSALAEREAAVLRDWLTWAGSRFDTPPAGPSTWDPEHLEYAFVVAGRGATSEAVLAAPEYLEGRLEWYDFEHTEGSLGASGEPTVKRAFRIPSPLDFAGMPNPRFWTFEDPAVRFDTLDLLAHADAPPSPATLMVLDFALSYSDDWFLVPLALDAWTIFEATTIAVTDVFGDTTVAAPPEGRWNMFRLDSTVTRFPLAPFFLAAAPVEANDGPGIEEVHLLADEVANVAWAVERLTQHPLGHGVAAPEQGSRIAVPTPPGLVWTMAPPPPPGNWFPLLPTEIGRLALGVLWSARTQRPAGSLLSDLEPPARRLHQEEVPPEGAQVVRRWQSARAVDGSLHFWIGRSKTPRRTDIPPAIRFDLVEWK